jgi:hypothetical protein
MADETSHARNDQDADDALSGGNFPKLPVRVVWYIDELRI